MTKNKNNPLEVNPDLPKTTTSKTKVRVTLIHETETGEISEEVFLEEETTSINSYRKTDTITRLFCPKEKAMYMKGKKLLTCIGCK